MPATELVAPMPPSAPADHLACSEKPSASWRQRGGLAACGAALVFLASIHGDRGSGEKPCAAIGQGAAGRDDARGRPAAFRSAARPAAPGALMPTTAGFVVDEYRDSVFLFGGSFVVKFLFGRILVCLARASSHLCRACVLCATLKSPSQTRKTEA